MHFLSEPDPDWPALAAREAEVWASILGPDLLACHHIGSTSVPDLAAKPVIDLLPVVTSLDVLHRATRAFISAGYEAMGAFGLEGRLYFRKDTAKGVRVIQAHAYCAGDPSITRHLAFREMLRADPIARQAYEGVKRRSDADSNGDIKVYIDLKDPWITKHEQIALMTYGTSS